MQTGPGAVASVGVGIAASRVYVGVGNRNRAWRKSKEARTERWRLTKVLDIRRGPYRKVRSYAKRSSAWS